MRSHQRNPRRRSIRKLAALSSVLTALTLSGASIVDASRGQPFHEVPISGVMFGEDTLLPPEGRCADWQWNYVSVGAATVSHLGSASIVVDHCSRFTSPTTGEFGAGTITLTAANGDVLVLDEWGTFELVGPTSIIDLSWTVNRERSTGRFANATGSGTAAPVGDLITNTTTGSMWGTIAYDASNRSSH